MVLTSAWTARAGALPRGAAAILLAAFAVLLPATARAVLPPDSGLRVVLGARCDSAGLVRVATHRSARLAQRLRLEADAVVLPGVARAALLEFGEPPEKRETRIAWSDVESVSLGRSRTGKGFVMGALLGTAAGGLIVGTYGPDLAEEGDHAVLAFGVLVGLGFTVLGTLFGAGHPEWTPVYP